MRCIRLPYLIHIEQKSSVLGSWYIISWFLALGIRVQSTCILSNTCCYLTRSGAHAITQSPRTRHGRAMISVPTAAYGDLPHDYRLFITLADDGACSAASMSCAFPFAHSGQYTCSQSRTSHVKRHRLVLFRPAGCVERVHGARPLSITTTQRCWSVVIMGGGWQSRVSLYLCDPSNQCSRQPPPPPLPHRTPTVSTVSLIQFRTLFHSPRSPLFCLPHTKSASMPQFEATRRTTVLPWVGACRARFILQSHFLSHVR